MGQTTSAERGTSSSVRQRPCLEKNLRDKDKCVSRKNGSSVDRKKGGDTDQESDSNGQVFRSCHVKERIDSLIEEYLTERTSANDSDSDDNVHAVSSTEDPSQHPSSSSVNDCEVLEVDSQSPLGGLAYKSTNGLRNLTPDCEVKSDGVDSTNAPPDSDLDKSSSVLNKEDSSVKMDGTSSLSVFSGPHGKSHGSHLPKNLCGSSASSGDPNHWKKNSPKKQIKLQTLIDKVLESSLGSPNDEKSGLLKSLSDVENDEKEINKLLTTSALARHSKAPQGRSIGERNVEDSPSVSKSSSNKIPKVDLNYSKDGLENFKTNIQKAFSARYEREKGPQNPNMSSPDTHRSNSNAQRHKSAVPGVPDQSTNNSHGRHQDIKAIFNVQQIIERVIKEADLQNEFGDDNNKRAGSHHRQQPAQSVPYNVHPSQLQRDNMAVMNNRHSEQHNRHRDYHPSVSAYSSHSKASEELKRSQPVYSSADRHHGPVVANRDYRYGYGRSRHGHHQLPHVSPSRDGHPTRPQSASYPGETHSEASARSDSYSHKSYKRHSPPPLVRIPDSQGAHAHRQQFGNKYPPDQHLPPPGSIRKDHYHDHMETNISVAGDVSSVYRTGQRMQMNAMHGNNVRGPENIHMRPMYPVPVPMALPFRGTLGPLPGPRSAAWIGGPEHAAISMQQIRQPHPTQPVHVTPRYPVNKHPNGIMPQRMPSQMMPAIVRESPLSQHSLGISNHTPTLSPSVTTDHKQRPAGSITKGTAPPPHPPQPPHPPPELAPAEPEKRYRRSNEELPLDLSKKPTTPSPAASSSDGHDSGRGQTSEEPNLSTHIRSLEESVEKYFHDYRRSKVPLDRLSLPDGVPDHQLYFQHRLMAEAHAQAQAQAQAQVHVQAQANAQAIAHAQAHAQAQEQFQAQAHHARAQAQAQAKLNAQNFQMHSPVVREHTPSRDPAYSTSPRQTSPHSSSFSVIQSPSSNNLHAQDSQHPQNSMSTPSPVPSENSKQSSKNMKQISKHEPIQSLLGTHAQNDILYLICRLCGQTYGSPYSFRKHFRNQHGFEPQAHHTQVQTISKTKSALHPSIIDGGELPSMETDSHVVAQHPPITPETPIIDRLPAVERQSPLATQGESQSEQKPVIVNGVSSDSRPSSVLSGPETKSDSGSACGDKSVSIRSKPSSSDMEEGEERRFLSCQECGKEFQLNDFGLYKKHCRAHEKERQGKSKCTDCRSSFCESHPVPEIPYRPGVNLKRSHLCHLCNLIFPNATALSEHIEMDHRLEEIQQHDPRLMAEPQVSSYECLNCKKIFKDLKIYVDHQRNCLAGSVGTLVKEETHSSAVSVASPSGSSVREDDNSSHPIQVGESAPQESEESKVPKQSPTDELSGDSVNSLWKKKKSAIKLTQPEGNSVSAPVIVNGDSKDSCEEFGDLYRHKKFSRLPAKRRDSDLESLESVSSSKKQKLDVPSADDNRRASTCSSMAASPAGSSVRSACSSPNSANEEPSGKTDFKKHSKFAKGMKYVGLNVLYNKGDSSPSGEQVAKNTKPVREKSKPEESPARAKREKKDKGKKGSGDKTEARHQLPFVWDRVTRSKAGKHAKK